MVSKQNGIKGTLKQPGAHRQGKGEHSDAISALRGSPGGEGRGGLCTLRQFRIKQLEVKCAGSNLFKNI